MQLQVVTAGEGEHDPGCHERHAMSRRRMERTDSLPRFFRHVVPSVSLSPETAVTPTAGPLFYDL